MTYIPEAVTPGDEVLISNFTTRVGKIAAMGEKIVIVNLEEDMGTEEISLDRLPLTAKEGDSLRLSRWYETADSLGVIRVVSEVRIR